MGTTSFDLGTYIDSLTSEIALGFLAACSGNVVSLHKGSRPMSAWMGSFLGHGLYP